MINFEVKVAIFDVDDTLLDDKPGIPGQGVHEQSRHAAVFPHPKAPKYVQFQLLYRQQVQGLQKFGISH